ncbi:MAG: hypothetical protein ACE5I2_00155 [Anaerolineae bacterium]
MAETAFWIRERFPVVYEEGKVKAFLVDAASFAQIELILENLLNREGEPEDTILAASAVLQRLAAQARQEPSSPDWNGPTSSLSAPNPTTQPCATAARAAARKSCATMTL